MLNKILKYDLKYMYKLLAIFYAFTLIFAGFTRLFFSFTNSTIMTILGNITSGITICLMINILINNMIRLWSRVVVNLYKDESYLTHTLPVEKSTIYTSKFISSIVTTFTSVLVILLAITIAYYSKENLELLKASLEATAKLYDTSIINFLLTVFFVFFLEVLMGVQAGFTGIIIGHRKEDGKLLKSIIYGLGFYLLSNALSLLLLFMMGLANEEIMHMFTMKGLINISTMKTILYAGIIFYIAVSLIYYCMDIAIFKKGVDVD